jgi:hypothetical protein
MSVSSENRLIFPLEIRNTRLRDLETAGHLSVAQAFFVQVLPKCQH